MRHPLPFAPRRGRVQAKRSTQGMHENHRNNLSLNNDSLSHEPNPFPSHGEINRGFLGEGNGAAKERGQTEDHAGNN